MPISNPGAVPASSLLIVAETEVYSTNLPVSWTDLDLSGTVGANSAEVLLKVAITGGTDHVAFRKNGDTDEFFDATVGHDPGVAKVHGITYHQVVKVATDAAGIIEVCAATGRVATIDVIDFIA